MSEKLLCCPFCGGEAELYGTKEVSRHLPELVHCANHTCRLFSADFTPEEWNRRPSAWIPVREKLPELNAEELEIVKTIHEPQKFAFDRAVRVVRTINSLGKCSFYEEVHMEKLCAIIAKLTTPPLPPPPTSETKGEKPVN